MGNTQKASTPTYSTVASFNPYATAVVNGSGSYFTLNPFLTQQNSRG